MSLNEYFCLVGALAALIGLFAMGHLKIEDGWGALEPSSFCAHPFLAQDGRYSCLNEHFLYGRKRLEMRLKVSCRLPLRTCAFTFLTDCTQLGSIDKATSVLAKLREVTFDPGLVLTA